MDWDSKIYNKISIFDFPHLKNFDWKKNHVYFKNFNWMALAFWDSYTGCLSQSEFFS